MIARNISMGLVLVALLAPSAWGNVKELEVADTPVVVAGSVEVAKPADMGVSPVPDEVADDAGGAELEAVDPAPVLVAEASLIGVPKEEAGAEKIEPDAIVPESAEDEELVADPLEVWNRVWFHFNDKLYFWLLKPLAQGYQFIMPEPVRICVKNFFNNATMPIRFVNSALQGKGDVAGRELARFFINTTIGGAGFFDIAAGKFSIKQQNEDLGQTLGHYGLGGGLYIVWPLFGPSTIRDTVGFVGDSFMNPITYIRPWELQISLAGYNQLNRLSLELGEYEDITAASLEPYTAIRDAYIQHRNELIRE